MINTTHTIMSPNNITPTLPAILIPIIVTPIKVKAIIIKIVNNIILFPPFTFIIY